MHVTTADLPVSDTSSSNLRVVEVDPGNDPRWTAFVLTHPRGSVYHHPAWLEALSREYRQQSLHLACESDKGELLALMPMVYTRGLPFHLGGPLTAPRLSSLPRTPLAGPLSKDRSATLAILGAALDRVRERPGMQLQIKMPGPELDGLVEGVCGSPWRNSYCLELPATSEKPFRINDGPARARVRWAVNKAAKLGVRVRPAETEADLYEWYGLYLDTMRRNTVPPRPYRFFCALWEILRPQELMQLLVAEHRTDGVARIVAGSIFLTLGDTVSYAFNGSHRAALALRPNDAIQWEAINNACRDHYRRFDLGEVPEGHHDLARFKSKWGAQATRLYRYYSLPSCLPKTVAEYPPSQGASLAKTVWERLPLRATEWIGNRIYSYL